MGIWIMLGRGAAGAVWQEGAAFQQLIRNEIHVVRERQQALLTQGKTGYATLLILLSCIITNVISFLALPEYIPLFIAASVYLHMFYFLTLLIPIGEGTVRFPTAEIRRIFSTLYHTGIIPSTDRFTRIMLDAFFINSRTLSSGFFCIFTIDLLYTGIAYYGGLFSLRTVAVISFQVVAILIFYFLLWRFDPGTARFKQGIAGMKGTLAGKRYPSWLIAVMFVIGALLVLFVILSTIILLPGITLKAFLSLSGIGDLTNLFLFITLIAVSQYFIVRFFHGIMSSRMAERFSEFRIVLLQTVSDGGSGSVPEGTDEQDAPRPATSGGSMRNAAGALLESRMYRLELRTLFGTFPVYLVNPDFSVLFDEQVIAVITGYLKGAGSSSKEQE
jgi:hypothetical protein